MSHTRARKAGGLETLKELATEYDIQLQYTNAFGKSHRAPRDTLIATLTGMGVPLEPDLRNARELLKARRAHKSSRLLEPVTVVWDGEPAEVPLRLPRGWGSRPVAFVVEEDTGKIHEGKTLPHRRQRAEAKDPSSPRHAMALPDSLPWGYHRIRVLAGDQSASGWVFRAPARAYLPEGEPYERIWGVFLPLYSLRSARNWGVGDYTDLERFIGEMASHGAQVIGMLPLYPSFYRGALSDCSPYRPVTRLFWNELFVDPTRAPGWEEGETAFGNGEFEGRIRRLVASETVDYAGVARVKDEVLRELSRRFLEGSPEHRKELERFARQHPRARDYAVFQALYSRFDAPWQQWPEPLREGRVRERDYSAPERDHHLFVQWLAHRQLDPLVSRKHEGAPWLYLDLPVGVHPSGYDTWRERESFALGASAGAPPDLMFTGGQNWGFNPLHPDGIRETGYRHIIEYVGHLMSKAGIMRIDHVMGLHRMYWIPEGLSAAEGAYVRYRAEELYAVMAIESWRHKTFIIGEDLGTVPAYVPRTMEKRGLQRMYVLQYEVAPDSPEVIKPVPRQAMATLNTHDMWPFAGYWEGTDIDQRRELNFLDGKQATAERKARAKVRKKLVKYLRSRGHKRDGAETTESALASCLHYLASSQARTLVLDLESLWGERLPQNIPGATGYPNWQRKARYALEELAGFRELTELLEEISAIRSGKTKGDQAWLELREKRILRKPANS